jgi:hypothetical protein
LDFVLKSVVNMVVRFFFGTKRSLLKWADFNWQVIIQTLTTDITDIMDHKVIKDSDITVTKDTDITVTKDIDITVITDTDVKKLILQAIRC